MRTHYRTSFAILAANLTSLYIPGSPDEAWPTAGREPWPDDTTPRTDAPVRFQAFLAPAPKLWKRPVVGRFFSQVA